MASDFESAWLGELGDDHACATLEMKMEGKPRYGQSGQSGQHPLALPAGKRPFAVTVYLCTNYTDEGRVAKQLTLLDNNISVVHANPRRAVALYDAADPNSSVYNCAGSNVFVESLSKTVVVFLAPTVADCEAWKRRLPTFQRHCTCIICPTGELTALPASQDTDKVALLASKVVSCRTQPLHADRLLLVGDLSVVGKRCSAARLRLLRALQRCEPLCKVSTHICVAHYPEHYQVHPWHVGKGRVVFCVQGEDAAKQLHKCIPALTTCPLLQVVVRTAQMGIAASVDALAKACNRLSRRGSIETTWHADGASVQYRGYIEPSLPHVRAFVRECVRLSSEAAARNAHLWIAHKEGASLRLPENPRDRATFIREGLIKARKRCTPDEPADEEAVEELMQLEEARLSFPSYPAFQMRNEESLMDSESSEHLLHLAKQQYMRSRTVHQRVAALDRRIQFERAHVVAYEHEPRARCVRESRIVEMENELRALYAAETGDISAKTGALVLHIGSVTRALPAWLVSDCL